MDGKAEARDGAPIPPEARAPRRKPSASVADQPVPTPPPARVKSTVDLSWKASEVLGLHALKLKKSRSEIVEELILEHLRRFSIHDLGGGKADKETAA